MGVGRWIGGFLGFMSGGPLGALAGYAIGWLFEKGAEGFSEKTMCIMPTVSMVAIQSSSNMRDNAIRFCSRCLCSLHIS